MHKLQIPYEKLLETIQEGIWVIDADSNTTFVNPKMAEILGYAVEEMIGKNLFECMDEEEIQNAERKVESRKSGLAETHESRLKHKDGHAVYVELKTVPITDDEGNYKGAIAGVADITDRKKTEKALMKSDQELRTIAASMTDVVAMADVEGRFTYLSESNYHLSGYKPSELLGKNILDLIHEDDLSAVGAIFQEGVVEGRKDARVEYRVRHKKGGYVWVETIGSLVLDDNGQPSGALFVSRDITDRKKAEEALQLQASERAAVDAFTNSVSHDLQTPLRRIEGFSEALLEECPDELSELARDYLQRITRQIGSMKERTDALLKLSKIVSHDITREEVNLSALPRAYLKRRCTVEPERQIETAIATDLVASGDAHLLSIVIENLLHNAWKYTAETEKACIECGSLLKDGRTVYFVKDNGAGFDQQHAAEIFDPFKKLHGEADYPGIGIGLNIAYRIITRHGGEIWAEGEQGKAACFYFTLP